MSNEQGRQALEVEQVFEASEAADRERRHRSAGSMSWKTISERDYLHREVGGVWKSLGPRSEASEAIHSRFSAGRAEIDARLAGLRSRLEQMALVNRALGRPHFWRSGSSSASSII